MFNTCVFKNTQFLFIYRLPSSDFDLFFDKLSDLCNAISLNYKNCKVTLSGDFNLHLLSKGYKNVTQYVSLLYM